MECSMLDLLQMQKHHFRPSACYSWKQKLPGTLPSSKLVHNSAPISPRNSLPVSTSVYVCTARKSLIYALALCGEKINDD